MSSYLEDRLQVNCDKRKLNRKIGIIQNSSDGEIDKCVATVVGFNCSAPRTLMIENGSA